MLKFDFTKVFEPKTVMKAAPKRGKKKSSKKEAHTYLGDPNRISGLPDAVTAEYLSLYSDSLDLLLLPHVRYGNMTIGEASRYKDAVVENVFGNYNHLGIFHYLQDKNIEGRGDKELTTYAETLLEKGYHIRQEGNEYWLVTADFTRVANLTGPAPTAREVEELVFDESSAHVFLPDEVAANIGSLARTLGEDANVLAMQGNLDVLLSRITNEVLGGFLLNYNSLRNTLSANVTYRTNTDGYTALDLYQEGFRLGSRIAYPVSQHAELVSRDGDSYRIMPVNPEVNDTVGVNKTQLQVMVAKMRQDLLGNKVELQTIREVKNLYNTFAVLVEAQEGNTYLTSHQNMSTLIANGSDDYKRKLLEDLACLTVTEMILLGNSKFNLQSWTTLGPGTLYSYLGEEYFDVMDWNMANRNPAEVTLDSFLYGVSPDLAMSLITYLPQDYLNRLSAYELDVREYPREFMTLSKMFESNKEVVLGAL